MLRVLVLICVGATLSGAVPRLTQIAPALPYLSGSTEAEIVAEVEREALGFPVESQPPIRLKKEFTPQAPTEGTAERKCVAGGGAGPLRSGEFVIGGELSGPDPSARKRAVAPKIWWSPLHHGPKMELLVRARRVDSAGEYRYHGRTVVYGSGGPGRTVPLDQREYSFPSGVEFLHSGKWIVVATQGSDWGCFILTMPSPTTG
jgi:hypothetical protein